MASTLKSIEELIKEKKQLSIQRSVQGAAEKKLAGMTFPKTKEGGFDYVLFQPVHEALRGPIASDRPIEWNQIKKKENQIVFIDGVYQEALSEACCVIEPLDKQSVFQAFITKASIEGLHHFPSYWATLNSFLDSYGALIRLDKNPGRVKPITIVNYTTGLTRTNLALRLIFLVAEQTEATCIYEQVGSGGIFNTVIHAYLEKQAQLFIHHLVSEKSVGFEHFYAELKKEAKFEYHLYNRNAKFHRMQLHVKLKEENAYAGVYAVNLVSEQNQAHLLSEVHHLAESTYSHQQIKNISFDESRTSFEGKIHVEAIAQKTQAYQLSQNLVLSGTPANFSKPNLQIYADDVKASHGATFAKVDPEALFYLQSRGIKVAEAKRLLVEGFISEFFEKQSEEVALILKPVLEDYQALLKKRLY